MAIDRADSHIAKWKGKYYFIATNDADEQHTFSIREADTLQGILHAEEVVILDTKTYDHIKGFRWAPELHISGFI